jgi:hypothetical protein
MKKLLRPSSFFFLILLLGSCSTEKKIELFNGEDLNNWDIYVDSPDVLPEELFWVEDGIIHTAGVPNGYIRTRETYRNYKLHVEWKWTGKPTNSGVLLNVQGKEMIWPLCTECQLMHENAGDIVLIGKGSGISVGDTTYLVTSEEDRYKVIPKFEEVSEYPAGEWNSYDITLLDGTIEVLVNGVLQNRGSSVTLEGGNIALQSEGSPVQFRNIYLIPLD